MECRLFVKLEKFKKYKFFNWNIPHVSKKVFVKNDDQKQKNWKAVTSLESSKC